MNIPENKGHEATGLVMFGGRLTPSQHALHSILGSNLDLTTSERLIDFFNENIIIPLIKNNECGKIRTSGEKGFRVYDYRILSSEQIKTFFGMTNIPANRILVPYLSPSNYFAHTIMNEDLAYCEEFETYDKLINITYLVDDDSLYKFLQGDHLFNEENIAKKKVQDCSVSELLFAVKKKLDKR